MSAPAETRGPSTAAFAVRELRWSDIPELVALERELFPDDAWSEASWWGELAGRPRRHYVVVDDERGVAAYAGLDLGGEVADLMTIAVAPRAGGAGLGTRLLDEVERRAAAAGAAYLMLEVRADNTRARRLYDAAGYVELRVRRRYYQPGDVDAVIMRKALTDKGTHDEG